MRQQHSISTQLLAVGLGGVGVNALVSSQLHSHNLLCVLRNGAISGQVIVDLDRTFPVGVLSQPMIELPPKLLDCAVDINTVKVHS